ncbi:FAD-binding oxidoreductase [Bradyrhizobium sp. U87765 SZCCT0131]|nr:MULTISPECIES: FAD-binding oxidoreductase [unclassified Bradyrhizobium]MBR1219303.1 FAD-binding oxidoreductase [Bradyrhizobium sp. U87765 SZCCT0131]MBR1261954.1 FAD-binding oxidoreductase [Bradyrhizobium sp. U87765 SZCCT0134]MBR1306193.1 FAD-binding oxidoreductase [Bradyrhizobium sp. U87765 SZCCT0110]MBR1317736.1 FAD-binding oxidoreductase [Bradyrhizobium sp. U87765 SZCCT0109]MBR1351438.1 FAD-binding oxidoreductase [Bradyrhizobium sp. U87765 SZCCT0048]
MDDLSPHRLDTLIADLGDMPVITDPTIVRRRSRDFFWYSPLLNEALNGKAADLIVAPRDEAEVIRVAAACARHRVPLTVRAGGTGNYGQAVPLQGGVLLDITALNAIAWIRPGLIRVGAGARMNAIDAATQPTGWELRMHPSTKRTATIGGFVAGGSGGVGSVTYGGLRERGNIIAARIVTLEPEPRVIELRGDAAQKINRAYGTTGIITALEMPLAPAWRWIDVVVAFDDFLAAAAFGHEAARADGIVKKLLSPVTWPLPSYFGALKPACPEGKSVLLAMIAEPSLESFKALLGGRGTITLETPTDETPGKVPLYEYTWNHTTLQVLKSDRSVTYLQCLYPHDRLLDKVAEMRRLFPDEVLQHLEFIRFNGDVTCSGLPVVRYRDPQRLDEIIRLHEANGVYIANPHVYTVEDGSRYKRVDVDQLGFKQEVDPQGLLNPGKMRSFVAGA